jgi:hypothetical protein
MLFSSAYLNFRLGERHKEPVMSACVSHFGNKDYFDSI